MQIETYIHSTDDSTLAGNYLEPEPKERGLIFDCLKIATVFTMLPVITATAITYATSVIPSENRTMIREDFSKQLIDATRFSPVSALHGYTFEDRIGVEYYLSKNRDLVSFLSILADRLNSEVKVDSTGLELYRDIEEGWEKLFVVASTSFDDMDELISLEDSLFDEFFEPENDLIAGRIVLSLG